LAQTTPDEAPTSNFTNPNLITGATG